MKVLTTGQAAKALHVSIHTVHRLIQSGELSAERISDTSRYRIRMDDLVKFAEDRNITLDMQAQ